MKTLLTLLACLLYFDTTAQVPQPAMLSLNVIGGNGFDGVLSWVTKTSDGGFVLAYETTSTTGTIDSLCQTSNPDVIFQKFNADASVLEWTKCYTDNLFGYIFPQNDGSFIFGGENSAVPSGWAFNILKESATGSVLWSKNYGGEAASATPHGMIATNDGGFIMMGTANYADTDFTIHYGSFIYDDIAVIKLDSNGNKVWAKVIGGTQEDYPLSIVSAPEDGCYIVGYTLSNDYDCTANHGGDDIYLVRLVLL